MIKEPTQFSSQQDAIISLLYQQKNIDDWNQIARIAHEQYHFPQKNSKLYKQRYMNHINPSVFKIDWTYDEEMLFMKLHNQIGNKWATIAQDLTGKTDNCVKNHFYSKLRKLLRKLNKTIQFFLKKQFRPIDISILYKIVQAAEQRFKQKPNCEESVSQQCLKIETKMLSFAMFSQSNENDEEDQLKYTAAHIEEYKELIQEIYRVSKLYKRKSKKVRNSLIQAPVNNSRKKNRKDQTKAQDQQEQHSTKQNKSHHPKQKVSTTILVRKNFSYNQSKTSQNNNNNHLVEKQKDQQHELKDDHNKNAPQTNARIQVQQGDGIQLLLRTAGILHDEVKLNETINKNDRKSRKYSSSQYSVSSLQGNNHHQQKQQQPFLGTSNNNFQYSSVQSFTSQQMQSFLGFPMENGANSYANFTLSQKSSFKSYSQRDPSQIDNPFFDEYSSSNGRLMFPMNFNMPVAQQYKQSYLTQNNSQDVGGYSAFQYGNVFCQPQQDESLEKINGNQMRK